MSTSERLKAQLNLINLAAAYKACFIDKETGQPTKAGARVLRDLAAYGGASRSPVRVSPVSRQIDPLATMVATGRAEVVRRVLAYIELDPSSHHLMKDQNDE
jgi:hypothetical protein